MGVSVMRTIHSLLREGDVVVERYGRGVVHSVKEHHEGNEVRLVFLTREHDGKRESRQNCWLWDFRLSYVLLLTKMCNFTWRNR